MVQCVVDGCSSRSDVHNSLDKNMHYHRIPKNPEIRKRWLQAINKTEVKNSARVCSLHFKKESYYETLFGVHKLIGSPTPSLNLHVEETHEYTTDSSEHEQKPNVQFLEEYINDSDQSQQTGSKQIKPKIEITDNDSESSNVQLEEVTDCSTDSSEDEQTINERTSEQDVLGSSLKQESEEVKEEATHFSEDVQMLNVQPLEKTDNVSGSSNMKPGVRKYSVTTPLEKKLLKEIRKLQDLGQKRMEAINCLLQQNRRLLKRNSYLEQVNKYKYKSKWPIDRVDLSD